MVNGHHEIFLRSFRRHLDDAVQSFVFSVILERLPIMYLQFVAIQIDFILCRFQIQRTANMNMQIVFTLVLNMIALVLAVSKYCWQLLVCERMAKLVDGGFTSLRRRYKRSLMQLTYCVGGAVFFVISCCVSFAGRLTMRHGLFGVPRNVSIAQCFHM